MPIDSHKNLGLEDVSRGGPGTVAAGSSNSNSHNKNGGEISIDEMREVVSQLARVLPQLEAIAKTKGPK
jgi:hypothetical protein